jgi:Hg(II)-responsive transcriptional regulator
MMDSFTIGQLAKTVQVNVETVRYYERRGLLQQPPRQTSGYRRYSRDAVRRIQFIRRAQRLGFSLQEIDDLLRLRADPQSSCCDVKQLAESKIAELESRIRDLRQMQEALAMLTESCSGNDPNSECPIFDVLSTSDEG